MRGLSPVAASGDHSSSRCAGLSLSRPLLLQSTGSRRAGSVIVAHGPSCSVACGIFPDRGSNPCPLHWQADSQPLRHQGSPSLDHFKSWSQWPRARLLTKYVNLFETHFPRPSGSDPIFTSVTPLHVQLCMVAPLPIAGGGGGDIGVLHG